MPSEQAQIDALKADVTDGRRKIYDKIEDVEDRLADLKTEVHGLTIRADEREARHNERHAEIKAHIKEIGDSVKAQQAATASFNKEVLDALRARQSTPPPEPPTNPPAVIAAPARPTFAEQLNALDVRWVVVAIVAVLALGGVLTASDASHIVRYFIPAPAVATQPAAPAAP